MSQQRGRGGGRGGDFQGGRGRGGGDRGRGGGDRGGRGGGRGGPSGSVIFRGPATVDQRLSQATNDLSLVKAFSALKVTDPSRPLRPGYGTVGVPITLRANFFPFRRLLRTPVFDYSVEFAPKTDINRLKERIISLLEQTTAFRPFLPHVAHDKSSRLVSAKQLPQPLDIPVPYYEEGASGPKSNATVYIVSIKLTRELDPDRLTNYMAGKSEFRDYDPLPLLSALNLIVQQHASRTGVRVGKNKYFFPTSSTGSFLSPGITAYQGFFASVRPTYNQLMVNVNACMTAFIDPGNLADKLMEFSRNSRGAMPSLPRELVKKVKVTTTHLGYKRRYTIQHVASTTARNTTFDSDKYGKKTSIEQYFLKEYNIKLKHATDLPVIDVGVKKRTYLPAEICVIEAGQPFRGKLSEQQVTRMIQVACNPPAVNANAIVNNGFSALGLLPPTSPSDAFGIEISNEMTVCSRSRDTPPRLSYREGRPPNVNNGAWNILDVKFHRGAQIQNWSVLVVRDGPSAFSGPDDPRLSGLVEGFAEKMRKSGMSVPRSRPSLLTVALDHVNEDPGRIRSLNKIREVLKTHLGILKGKPAFVLVLLSQRDSFIYPGIKRIGDVELGIQTVHMLTSKIVDKEPNKQDQYFSNVALKVNTKLGGINHKLDDNAMRWLRKKTTMMVGIDVTHRGPGSKAGTPSIAAVVASVDNDFVQYPASLRLQQTDEVKEMLDELGDMMVERLQVYEAKNKALPERIFVFRDGVSEGQYDTVLNEELPQIRKAFQKFSTGQRKTPYKPLLSIVICGKRHHARFFPTDSAHADRNGNTRPGTVVDRGVTAVFEYDFYLQAHAGLQGSVKATHYTVIYDETLLTADEIQQGTNDFSYLYARATRAVSLIPPAYYADLACERGRCYLNDFLVDDKTSTAGGSTRGDKKAEELRNYEAAKKILGERNMRNTMFYI
ncbi:Piwi domain-containing protein [Rhodocollybia butyracea]|uniref:Piwi domain-containing protein n=1 Tax=Rhodocollybia butyracea TaxID=206335 RepID=A0A9P5Q3B4_9AGAR|nr:Piwi domain-containing protein [Rhodocollybia butyracea]